MKTATTSAHRGTVARTIHPSNNALRRPVDFDDDFGFSGDFFGVPGLGFDEAHLAAIRGPRAFHRRFGFSGGISPFFGGGFLFPSPVVIEQAPATEVQQEEEAQPVAQEPAQRFRTRESYVVQPVEPAAAPQGASEEYVFVRRDGTLFFAVAYSWDNQTLRYITQEGVRRSVTREALDLAATQQFNEQRGLNFRLPA